MGCEVGVVNRSQSDILSNKNLSKSLEEEKEFFKNHPRYRLLPSLVGTQNLASKCNNFLTKHIQRSLPEIKKTIKKQLSEARDELQSLGESSPQTNSARGKNFPFIQNLF